MPRVAILAAVALLAAACSAAEAELARMEDVPRVAALDDNGNEVTVYDPAVVGVDSAEDLFPDEPENEGVPESNPDAPEPSQQPDADDTESAAASDSEPAPEQPSEPDPAAGVPIVEPVVIERYPHDGAAFTQGLEFVDGVLLESLGLFGESSRRRVEPTAGEVISSVPLSADLFGAGLTVIDGQVIQLTWQQGTAVVADLTTLIELGRISYDGEGWGLCALDDGRLVMSNGSGLLTFRDPATLDVTGEIEVTVDGEAVSNLNELECVGSTVYANVWLETTILEIDITSGEVGRIIDAASLVPGDLEPDDVLNGIAYNPASGTFYITGKRWTVMYEVSFG